MSTELVHIGFGNVLAINRVIAIISPDSAPTKRMVHEAKKGGMVVDMTSGRRTKAVLVIDSGHLVLAAIAPETIAGRVAASGGGQD
jgi:regulator of extracellular matrix RemA (YlzA/DUF370 family)